MLHQRSWSGRSGDTQVSQDNQNQGLPVFSEWLRKRSPLLDESQRDDGCYLLLPLCLPNLSNACLPPQCLAFRKLPPHCRILLLCFSLLKGLFLFAFFVLHSCTAWHLHQCLISPITAPIQIETGALTLHPPCTRPCAKCPTYLVAGLQTSEISLYWSHFTDEKAEVYRGI